MAGRKAISKKLRFEVFKRDGFKCMYCGAHPPSVLLHVDHIDPVANGGGNDINNLITACEPCNLGKGARLLSAVPDSLAKKTQDIAEMEAQLKGYHAAVEAKRERIAQEAWSVMNVLTPGEESSPKDWMNSVRNFVDKLGYYEVLDSMEMAVGRKGTFSEAAWRYFCGICWNKVRDLDKARQ